MAIRSIIDYLIKICKMFKHCVHWCMLKKLTFVNAQMSHHDNGSVL